MSGYPFLQILCVLTRIAVRSALSFFACRTPRYGRSCLVRRRKYDRALRRVSLLQCNSSIERATLGRLHAVGIGRLLAPVAVLGRIHEYIGVSSTLSPSYVSHGGELDKRRAEETSEPNWCHRRVWHDKLGEAVLVGVLFAAR